MYKIIIMSIMALAIMLILFYRLKDRMRACLWSSRFFWIYLFFIAITPLYPIDRSDNIPPEVWEMVFPYLLPDDHPIKPKLDILFSDSGVNHDILTLIKAGFHLHLRKEPLRAIVGTHRLLKGYVIKTYVETQPVEEEWHAWIRRIKGADLIREAVEIKGYSSTFKTPHKWIYPLPYSSEIPRRRFILVAEDMRLVSNSENEAIWEKGVTFDQLTKLYDLIESLGLIDSVYIDNIPFRKDRRIALVDTENTLQWPIDYSPLNQRLAGNKRKYWKILTRQ